MPSGRKAVRSLRVALRVGGAVAAVGLEGSGLGLALTEDITVEIALALGFPLAIELVVDLGLGLAPGSPMSM